MKDKDVHRDDEYGGANNKMELSEDDRTCSILNRERKIEEDIEREEKEDEEDEEDEVEWDGSEAERVADIDAEEYEENSTGIRFTYILEKEEIYKSLKHSKAYRKNEALQVKHTVIQIAIILILIVIAFTMNNFTFVYVALVPLLSIIGIWTFPKISLKKLSRDMSDKKNISIEIFPDAIDIDVNGLKSEILLDGKCEYEELEDIIILTPPKGSSLIIPVRSIEPEFLPDVQAMIVSGTLPGNEGRP